LATKCLWDKNICVIFVSELKQTIMEIKYFLFGSEAISRYVNAGVHHFSNPMIVNGMVFRYDESEMDATDLLDIAIGWDDYTVIDESDYEVLKSKGY
jgi:hypothetical protein